VPPLVVAVVLSWNRRDDTLACLRSLRGVGYSPVRVVVVDNGSTDGSADAVAAEFPDAELVRNDVNRGYAGGMNDGIGRALDLGADHVLLMNNDVEVDPGFVSQLVDEAGRAPDAAALSPVIVFADRPDLVWYAGAPFDPERGYNGRITGYRKPVGQFREVIETQRAAGTALLIPRGAIERVGVFDEGLFAYSEDTDWSLRARAAGYRLLVVPAARVRHRVSQSSGGENSPATMYYGLRNALVVAERHAPLGRLGTWRRRTVLVAVHLLQALRSRRRRAALRAVAEGWRDWRRGRLGPRPE
jgi:GT2 family glycosyltransferase